MPFKHFSKDYYEQENIFGEDQWFTDMQQTTSTGDGNANNGDLKSEDSSANIPMEMRDDFDHRNYRPLEVDVSVIAHDVQAHLLKNCTEKDPPCPIILIERFGFEMKKRYDQTELQLLVSPSVLLVSDTVNRCSKDRHLNQGKLTLSSLQVFVIFSIFQNFQLFVLLRSVCKLCSPTWARPSTKKL